MSRLALVIVFAVALALALVATAPLSLGLRGALSARESSGTVWSGRLSGAAVGPLSLGEVKAGLDPLRLLVGKLRFRLEATGGQAAGRALATLGGHDLAVERLTGSAPLSALGAPPPFDGVLRLKDFDAVFARGQCKRAAGDISADLTGLGDQPLALAGKPLCQGQTVALPLSGSRDGVQVTVLLTLRQDGRYRGETRVITQDPALGAVLTGAGFARDGDGFGRTNEGRLQ
jgi:general secretion pathway protein N